MEAPMQLWLQRLITHHLAATLSLLNALVLVETAQIDAASSKLYVDYFSACLFDSDASLASVGILGLGKVALLDDAIAKLYIPVIARELELTEFPSLRNNCILVLTDLCRR